MTFIRAIREDILFLTQSKLFSNYYCCNVWNHARRRPPCKRKTLAAQALVP